MVNRRRVATSIKVLPPRVVPITAEDHEQAVTALAQLIEQWWRKRRDAEGSVQPGDGSPSSRGHHERELDREI